MEEQSHCSQEDEEVSKYVRICSGDGAEFVIPFDIACVSTTLKNMLCGPGEYIEANSIITVPSQSIKSLEELNNEEKIHNKEEKLQKKPKCI